MKYITIHNDDAPLLMREISIPIGGMSVDEILKGVRGALKMIQEYIDDPSKVDALYRDED